MPIFGQVWLWSLLAFLLGTLLCWVLVVLPIRKRIYALERRLATIRSETQPAAPERSAEVSVPAPPAAIVPGFGGPDPQDEIRSESLTRAYAMPGLPDPPPSEDPEARGALRLSPDQEAASHQPAGEATDYIGSLGSPLAAPRQPMDTSGWFEDERKREREVPAPRADHHLVDDADQDDDDRGTIFTQRTTPIPAELIRRLDEGGPGAAPVTPAAPVGPKGPAAPAARDDSLVDDLEDEPAAEPPVPAEEPAPPVFTGADTVVVHKNGAHQRPEPKPEPRPEPEPQPEPAPEPVAQERSEERIALVTNKNTMRAPIIELNKPLELDRQQSALPKRVPSKPQHRHPFGVQTVSPAATAPVVATPDTGSERMRSLFEPVIPAETTGGQQNAVLPPPHRLHTTESRPSAPGPFGPGSAMPLPGGASPSPEFTVKASVTALRYCTPESPQFGKTVAEVWFRSASDAERVGFRPVG
jgi:hypothetical protein